MASLVCAKPSTPQWRASMDEKKIEEVMALVDVLCVESAKIAVKQINGKVEIEDKFIATRALIKEKLRQLLGEQHG